MNKLISIFVAAFTFALWSNGSSAQIISVTNGYICAPKNPGGEETRLFFRQQEGVAINLSTTATFPVVCPVIIPGDNPPYMAGTEFKNGSSVGQNFACALEEYDPAHNLVKSTGRSIYIPGNGNDYILFTNYYLSSVDNNLSIRCILPPRGMIGSVLFY
jgi:hypothetical protein